MIALLLALVLAGPDRPVAIDPTIFTRTAHADTLCQAAGYRNGVHSYQADPRLGPGAWIVVCHPTKWQREHGIAPQPIRAGRL